MIAILPVDAAYAFDYLAILEVKLDKGMPVRKEFDRVLKSLSSQFNTKQVRHSKEYLDMLRVNAATFDAVEMAHSNSISASDVQLVNHDRYLAKKALQRKFWPESELEEQKTLIAKSDYKS